MLTLIGFASAVTAVLTVEWLWHRHSRRKIPHRIHVNGIRGKSSVVRLIAAGLREGGVQTWAKVTGTLPNVVDEGGRDISIVRGSPPSIIEQRAVIAEAAASGARALVVECMALEPAFQRAEESLLQPTISVITNVRVDHEEVFGSSPLDIALALSNTVPHRGILVTTAGEGLPVLSEVASHRRSSLVVVDRQGLTDDLVRGFSYFEHKENVALALAVCQQVGVEPAVALRGMRACPGDPGALTISSLSSQGKTLRFINAMAANDPESTLLLYERTVVGGGLPGAMLVLVNSRKDRPLRSRQLGRLLAVLPGTRYFLVGDDSDAVFARAVRAGVDPEKLEVLEVQSAEGIAARMFEATDDVGIAFAIGNTAGLGLEVALFFAEAGTAIRPS